MKKRQHSLTMTIFLSLYLRERVSFKNDDVTFPIQRFWASEYVYVPLLLRSLEIERERERCCFEKSELPRVWFGHQRSGDTDADKLAGMLSADAGTRAASRPLSCMDHCSLP